MDLKKRINFTWKKEDNFVVSLFVSLFLFSTGKNLCLVKFYNAAVRGFVKTFRKYVVWCKNSRVIKDLSNSGSFYLLVFLNIFLFFLRSNFAYFRKIFLAEKSIKLERVLCKDKSFQKFRKCYS